jgi:hypothetical protein
MLKIILSTVHNKRCIKHNKRRKTNKINKKLNKLISHLEDQIK